MQVLMLSAMVQIDIVPERWSPGPDGRVGRHIAVGAFDADSVFEDLRSS
jgi:hypothetical protein